MVYRKATIPRLLPTGKAEGGQNYRCGAACGTDSPPLPRRSAHPGAAGTLINAGGGT